ncbi:MAG: esterase/lipase family protein [Solirubrobacteraceae bacterium]
MRATDIEAIGELAGEALAAGGGLIKEMHEGIASRPFEIMGPSAAPARVIHDGVSRAVYTGVRIGLRAAARGSAAVLAKRAHDEGPALAATPAGSLALGAIHGLYGNHIEERGNRLALGMEIRRGADPIAVTPDGLAEGFPDATSRIAVFIHGLCETDESWRHFLLRGDRARRRTYGERLQDELSFTPVHVRYNTGLRISQNGRRLAQMLDDMVTAWPCGVEELVLVGHSMGGLVARGACHYAELDRRRWTDAVRHVFCLGTPHLGADLEKGANVLSWAFVKLPETRALGKFLDARSVGIKDLRFGSCIEEDWRDCDPDEYVRDRCQEVPFLPDANYYFIAATLNEGPVGTFVGDLLVRVPSASGRGNGKGRRIPFEVDNGCELSGLTHFDLLNHPAVYEQLRTWIMRPPARRTLPALSATPG